MATTVLDWNTILKTRSATDLSMSHASARRHPCRTCFWPTSNKLRDFSNFNRLEDARRPLERRGLCQLLGESA